MDILEREESFKVFLKSFLAGACKERKDFLASEVIRRFVNAYEFESEILDLMLNNDLVHTFRQYMNDLGFEKLFLNLNLESSGVNFLKKAFTYGARQCIMDMLNYLDTENDLETDCDKSSKTYMITQICKDSSYLLDTVFHHDPSCGNDWIKVLTKLAKLCPSQDDRNDFYRSCIQMSVCRHNIDTAFVFLKSIQSISYSEVKIIVLGILLSEREDLINTLCREMKRVYFKMNDLQSAELIMDCAFYNNEDMFNAFLNEFPCSLYHNSERGRTILHLCEVKNFSSSTLLRVLRRSQGKNLFNFLNKAGRTPVQCRAAYRKVRREVNDTGRGSSDCLCVCEIDWRDDTLVVNSSFKDCLEHNVSWRDDTLILKSSYTNYLKYNVQWPRALFGFRSTGFSVLHCLFENYFMIN